ncbi:MAG TPA: DUF3124 domain-containing protein [Oculatellaceae cyanobacterium]|jgi:hypothetical protein
MRNISLYQLLNYRFYINLFFYFYAVAVFVLIAGCTTQNAQQLRQQNANPVNKLPLKVANIDENKIVIGQTIYVPAYSHIYFENQQQSIDLSATLSIRNTDLNNSIIVTSVRYYDTNGKLVKSYLEKPIALTSLASTDFVVERTDKSGGLGANFIVEWVAEKKVSNPVVEAVMISAANTQGISFISPGRVIKIRDQKK